MNDEERDAKITEIYTDIKWLKAWTIEHKTAHFKYQIMLWVVAMGVIISYLR